MASVWSTEKELVKEQGTQLGNLQSFWIGLAQDGCIEGSQKWADLEVF